MESNDASFIPCPWILIEVLIFQSFQPLPVFKTQMNRVTFQFSHSGFEMRKE